LILLENQALKKITNNIIMKRKLPFILALKIRNFFIFFVTLFLFSATSFGQTSILTDDFNRLTLSPGGSPSVNYTSTLVGIASSSTTSTTDPDYRLQILGGATAGTAGKSFTMAVMPTSSNYNATLHSNTGLVSWSFNIRHNRSSGSTMSGFDPTQWGIGTVIACDNADPTNGSAKGYAVVMGGVGAKNTYDLVSFTNGLNSNANLTPIIQGITLSSWKNVVSVKLTYDPSSNKWNMYQKDEGSATSTVAYPDPSAISVDPIGEVVDLSSHVNSALANFGFIFSHGTTLNNSAFFDNFKVTVGSVTTTTYYLKANSDCSILNNWWSNIDASSGVHPIDFNADNQIFNIFTNGATIGSDWTVNGSGSKVVLGNGTDVSTLGITNTAYFNGKIDLSEVSTLTIEPISTIPTLNLIALTSTVIYNGTGNQIIQGATYGNLVVNTLGTGTASGAITIDKNLTISNNSILDMGVNKVLGVGSVSGSGSLKTAYSSSSAASALPADITWPYSVFYNSLEAVQSIVQGNYANLDISGGGVRNFLSAQISISENLNADGVAYNSGTSSIIYNGTAPQTIGLDFPAFSMKIANTSVSGLSLSASDRITDDTNIELAGNFNSAGFSETFGLITLTDNSILNLGSGIHSLSFPNCSSEF